MKGLGYGHPTWAQGAMAGRAHRRRGVVRPRRARPAAPGEHPRPTGLPRSRRRTHRRRGARTTRRRALRPRRVHRRHRRRHANSGHIARTVHNAAITTTPPDRPHPTSTEGSAMTITASTTLVTNIGTRLRRRARMNPDLEAIVDVAAGRRYTYTCSTVAPPRSHTAPAALPATSNHAKSFSPTPSPATQPARSSSGSSATSSPSTHRNEHVGPVSGRVVCPIETTPLPGSREGDRR